MATLHWQVRTPATLRVHPECLWAGIHLTPLLPSENTQAEVSMSHWTRGGSPQTHTHAHTRTELMKHENLKSQHVMPLGFFLYSLTFIQTGKLSIFQEEIVFAATAWGVGEAPFSR